MQRRKFIKNLGTLSAAPLILNGALISPNVSASMLPLLLDCDAVQDRSVVVLFLKGGNDGLNTIVPTDQYDAYYNHRPTIALSQGGANGYIPLDDTLPLADQVGLNPGMGGFKAMYDAGKARLIHAVGYPSHNQSHFKSTDLWLSGNDGEAGGTQRCGGWMGRYFEQAYPGVIDHPSTALPDPLGIQLGESKPTLAFHDCSSNYTGVNLSGQDPGALFGLLSGLGADPLTSVLDTDNGEKLAHIIAAENSTNVFGERITDVYEAGSNSSAIYPDNGLANDFATVARLLAGGSTTKFFQLHHTGFDTHNAQVVEGDTGVGKHAVLLGEVFDSIKAFHDDLSNLGMGNKVVTVVFSEFSRRITDNASFGTDHGNFGPMFMFGNGVRPGVSGTNFDLGNVDSESGVMDLSEMQHDYRTVFKTILQDWMGGGQ